MQQVSLPRNPWAMSLSKDELGNRMTERDVVRQHYPGVVRRDPQTRGKMQQHLGDLRLMDTYERQTTEEREAAKRLLVYYISLYE